MTYVVLARLRNEEGRNTAYVRVAGTESADWALAQERWAFFDEALRKGRLYTVKDDPKWLYVLPANVAYLAVRDLSDPQVAGRTGLVYGHTWGDAARETVSLVVADNKEAKHIGSLERRWGNAHGYHGHIGGWIFRNPHRDDERPVNQGWWTIVPRKTIGHVLQRGGGYIMPKPMPDKVLTAAS